ncbi:uncharacterized protein LOC122507181 isoform X2 [Leptopilina heterotoma]|nr:uncharacterized protein LOC122500382 isoform X2 [Leptopilina heterotoma]XP_043465229.1 uncharacterized protein LOC122500382 isoform X2 [Leptopilina heterotoma]XP_043475700.1 uncharacterized protein LOC122507181 isoform X2 [Leptopilina heterotoma]XP_043475701.1 uncharacterized protein LOC122507181 isoform X2 [Leptopilina heterotoma]XP_043475702.1 uncharacterized protein LOC122507181 isoform X2 [Leptopilina heterotoma]XP_043475703.1 uncharacterized protein LOC122507181 isoform X2 [Leptopilina
MDSLSKINDLGKSSEPHSHEGDDEEMRVPEPEPEPEPKDNEIIFTSNEEFDAIEPNDTSLEVTGYVDKVTASKIVGRNTKYRVMSFILNNGSGTRCMVSVWGKEIDRIEPDLQVNMVLLIEGAEALSFKDPKFNEGTTSYQLNVKEHTKFTVLKSENCKQMENIRKPKTIEFEDASSESGFVKIKGFIKSAFRLLTYTTNEEHIWYGVGTLTNGNYKMEIRIKDFAADTEYLEKGDHVEVEGILKFTKYEKLIYLSIDNTKCIKIIDEKKMKYFEITKCNNSLVKIM